MLGPILVSLVLGGSPVERAEVSVWGWTMDGDRMVCHLEGDLPNAAWEQWGTVDSDRRIPESGHSDGLNGNTDVYATYVAAGVAWNDVSCSDFRFIYDNPKVASRSVPSNDGRPHIKFQRGGGWLAACWLIYGGGNNRECDIEIDSSTNWYIGPTGNPGGSQFDLYTTVLHEMGHAFGLGHSSNRNAVMYAYLSPGETKRTPTSDDRNGICGLYPN